MRRIRFFEVLVRDDKGRIGRKEFSGYEIKPLWTGDGDGDGGGWPGNYAFALDHRGGGTDVLTRTENEWVVTEVVSGLRVCGGRTREAAMQKFFDMTKDDLGCWAVQALLERRKRELGLDGSEKGGIGF